GGGRPEHAAHPPAPLPADVTTVPTAAGPMMVGPITAAIWPIARPMNVSPAAGRPGAPAPAVAPRPGVRRPAPPGQAPGAAPARGSVASSVARLAGPTG